jgi:hypothetical protein
VLASESTELIRIVPGLLWIALAAAVLFYFRGPVRDDLLPRLSAVKLPGGIEIALEDRVVAAAAVQHVSISADDTTRIVRRLERSATLLRGAQILWVDDHPERNLNEAALLEAFGAQIAVVTTTADALQQLDRTAFHVVISDVDRQDSEADGKAGLTMLALTGGRPYTILYVGTDRADLPTPSGAFGITSFPHQLLHYVLDALERERG